MATSPVVIERGLKAAFAMAMSAFLAARQNSPGIFAAALNAPSDGYDEKYGWLGAMPGVQEWIGELNVKDLADYDYTIRNRDWVTGVPINQNDLDDDRVGALAMVPELLVKRITAHPEKLLISLLTGGTTSLAYDGVAFFSNTSGVRTIDNLLAGSGTTLAQLETDLNTALTEMAKFTDDQGEALNVKGNMIVCPVALENKFKRLVLSDTDPTASAQGTFNPYAGRFTVIGDARLDAADVNDWYLLATDEVMKPLVLQMREQAKPQMEKTPGTKTWQFSAGYRGNVGYGLPQLAIKTVNT